VFDTSAAPGRAGSSALVHVTSPVAISPEDRARAATWMVRHESHKAENRDLHRAKTICSSDSLKAALRYLKMKNPDKFTPAELARFLFLSDDLDKAEVGDFLGALDGGIFSEQEYAQVRAEFVKLLDFTGLTFDEAMRTFLCDSNFRLPGEAQKIDRILEAFCHGYCSDNPKVFRDSGSAFVLAFAIIMLNTDAHNDGIKPEKKMTFEQFARNLEGVDDGNNFPLTYLTAIYNNIVSNAIKFQDKASSSSSSSDSAEPEELTLSQQADAAVKEIQIFVRKAVARLRTRAPLHLSALFASSADIVSAMYEASWFKLLPAIACHAASDEETVVHYVLDGLEHGTNLAIELRLEAERNAFAAELAKLTFADESNRKEQQKDTKDKGGGKSLHLRLLKGEHLKQAWFRSLGVTCAKDPVWGVATVKKQVSDLKAMIHNQRRKAMLIAKNALFGGDILLVNDTRQFVLEGRLVKIAAKSSDKKHTLQSYQFFLFSDLFLYASDGIKATYKPHRVMHLSLCRLVDIKGGLNELGFKIASPQKSIVVLAADAKQKAQWMDAIHEQLQNVRTARKAYMEKLKSGGASSPVALTQTSEDVDMLRRYSTFIGSTALDEGGVKNKKVAPMCKLCIRPLGFLRRRIKCKWCADVVCNECCSHKVKLPSTQTKSVAAERVCDACFGAVAGMVGDDQELFSEEIYSARSKKDAKSPGK